MDRAAGGFRHEAMIYEGIDDFVAQVGSFITDAVDAAQPVLVATSDAKIKKLKESVGEHQLVEFVDMPSFGVNPNRIIPVWRAFADRHAGVPIRGIGEPIWEGRSAEELVECHRHESLLNLAFEQSGPFWLRCPYDAQTLDPSVLADAELTHPASVRANDVHRHGTYRGLDELQQPFDLPLAEPDRVLASADFGLEQLDPLRSMVAETAAQGGVDPSRVPDLVLAVNEVVTNSIKYGGGSGSLRMWKDRDRFVVEVSDRGGITDPLAGRHVPTADSHGGFGLWLVNQVCDLVQIRTFPGRSVVRLFMRLGESIPAS